MSSANRKDASGNPSIRGRAGSAPKLRTFADSDSLAVLAGAGSLRTLAGGDSLRVFAGGEKTLRPPLFGYDPDFPETVFVYERAAWLTRDGEEVEIDIDFALSRGIRMSKEGEEVVMLR